MLIDSLEPRRLMADVSVVLASTTLASTLTASAAIKPTAKATFTVAKSADVLSKIEAKTKILLTAVLHPVAGGADIFLGSAKVPASSLAKTSKNVNITFSKLKVAPATAGAYELQATLSGQSAAGDTNAANDSVSSPITVNPDLSREHPFPGSNLANTIFFELNTGVVTPFVQGGQHRSNLNSLVGLWSYSPKAKNLFLMSVTAEPGTSVQGRLKIKGSNIGNRTMVFGVDKAGSDGSLTLDGSKKVIYIKFG